MSKSANKKTIYDIRGELAAATGFTQEQVAHALNGGKSTYTDTIREAFTNLGRREKRIVQEHHGVYEYGELAA